MAKGTKPREPGGAARAAERWQSGNDELGLASEGCQMATKSKMEVRGQGSSMERDAARTSGYPWGQRLTLNEQEQKRSNFCAFLRPLQRSKTRRDRCHCLLLERV